MMMKNAKLLRTLVLAAVLVMLAVLPAMAMAAPVQTTTETLEMVVGGVMQMCWPWNDELQREQGWFEGYTTAEQLNEAFTFTVEADPNVKIEMELSEFKNYDTGDGYFRPFFNIDATAAADGKKVTCTTTMNQTGEQYVHEYVVHVVGRRMDPTVEATPSKGFGKSNGDYVLTIEEGTPVKVTPNYETLSGSAMTGARYEWNVYGENGYVYDNWSQGSSHTFTDLKDGDRIEWDVYYGEREVWVDNVWLIVKVIPAGTIDDPVNESFSFESLAFLNGSRNICPFLHSSVGSIFVMDYDGDGEITPDELNQHVTMTVKGDSSVRSWLVTEKFDEYEYDGDMYLDYPAFSYMPTNTAADGKKVWAEITNSRGDKVVYEMVIDLQDVERKAPTIESEYLQDNGVDERGNYQVVVEQGSDVTITANYQTLAGGNANLTYVWDALGDQGTAATTGTANGNVYTIKNIAVSALYQWGATLDVGDEAVTDYCCVDVTVVPKGMLSGGPVDTTIAYGSPAMIGKPRSICPFYDMDVEQLFVKDYDADGTVTVEELNANVTFKVFADSNISLNDVQSRFTNITDPDGMVSLDCPSFVYEALNKNADGKKVWAEITSTDGDKVVYELTIELNDLVRKTPTITGTACTEAVEARDGTYFMTAEEGSSITVTLHYETLSGDKADVEYSWWIFDYATQDYTTTEPLSTASSYTFTNLPAAELDYEWHVSLKGEPNAADSTWITVEIVPKGTLFPEQELTRTEYETGISEVPEALQSIPELNTPAKIEAAISIELTAVAEEMGMDVQPEDKMVYDVSLQYSPDGGETWVKADETHWPEDGKLTVVLPYPEGTGQYTHTFAVAHMFTKEMNGNVPGTYEYPEVTNTAEGIRFEVTGLSPVALVWEEKPAPVVPATGDDASLALWISLMMLGAAGCMLAGRKLRRR